jgi:ABC-type uncharacterized transport system substrate-binding protein
LIALRPDVIIAHTTTACIALKRETTSIPVVFVNVVDPIGSDLSPAWRGRARTPGAAPPVRLNAKS